MWLALADDSEERGPRREPLGHLVGIGAVLFPEEAIAPYFQAVGALRERLGAPAEEELKWSPDNGSWLKGPEGNRVRTQLRQGMLREACALGVRSITVIWDRAGVDWAVDRIRPTILAWLYDKISMCLARINEAESQRCVLVVDEPGGNEKQRRAWLADTLPLTTAGTPYSKPEQVVLPILTAPSHHVPQLQLADLVAGATVAAVAGNRYAVELLPDLMRIAHVGTYGCVGGAGLTIWPPERANLYYHLCGDEKRWDKDRGVNFTLPRPGWVFFEDDGLPEC